MTLRDAGNWLLFPRRRLLAVALRDRRSADYFLEAILVLVIVTILSGIATERFGLLLNKIAMLEAASLVHSLRPAAAEAIALTGSLPTSIVGNRRGGGVEGRYFAGVEWRDSELAFQVRPEIAARFGPDAGRSADAADPLYLAFRFARFSEFSPLVILCGTSAAPPGASAPGPGQTNIAARHLPASCRN